MKRAILKLGTLVVNNLNGREYISDSTNPIQAEQDANYCEANEFNLKYSDENMMFYKAMDADIVIPHTKDMTPTKAYDMYRQEMLNVTDDEEFIVETWTEECVYVNRHDMSGWYILDASVWFRH